MSASAPSIIIKKGNTYPPLQATLSDSNGPINLTTATLVEIALKGTSILVTGLCTIVNSVLGEIEYQWAASDLNVVDTYEVEFKITWAGGPPTQIQTVPNSNYDYLQVVATLGE